MGVCSAVGVVLSAIGGKAPGMLDWSPSDRSATMRADVCVKLTTRGPKLPL